MLASDEEHAPLGHWVGRQLGEISRLTDVAHEAVTRDSERAALVISHALARGVHAPGTCDTCDAGRAWLKVWLAGEADAPRELEELQRVADMDAAAYQQHWTRKRRADG